MTCPIRRCWDTLRVVHALAGAGRAFAIDRIEILAQTYPSPPSGWWFR